MSIFLLDRPQCELGSFIKSWASEPGLGNWVNQVSRQCTDPKYKMEPDALSFLNTNFNVIQCSAFGFPQNTPAASKQKKSFRCIMNSS